MARRRYISPQFWESPTATRVGPGARLLLIGCWTLADDEGILHWDPTHLRELLFSHDPEVTDHYVSTWMNELIDTDAVVPYRGGKQPQQYGYLLGFEVAHRPGRPKPSTLPPPSWERDRNIIHAYLKRDQYRCHLCTGPVFWLNDGHAVRVDSHDLNGALDHLTDRAHGGTNYPSNIRAAHVSCRQIRATNNLPADAPHPAYATVEQVSRAHFQHLNGTLFDGVPVPTTNPQHAVETTPERTSETPSTDADSSIAGLTEPGNAALTTHSVSPAMPDSSPLSEDSMSDAIVPLTCDDADSTPTHDTFSESVVSLSGALTTDSPTERERERELEGETEPLSASRSCTAGGGAPSEADASQNGPSQTSASGAASNDKTSHDNPSHDDARDNSKAIIDTTQRPAPHDNTTRASVLSAADVVLDEHDPAPTPDHPHAGGEPVSPDESQDSLFSVPAEMVKEPEGKKKRKQPSTWTNDRKEQAHAILKPWWANYGEGFPQNYGVVFGVIISVLANKVAPEDIERALNVLGPERKPISQGTIAFALSKTTKQVAEDTAYEAAAAARSADKYTQRTM